METFQSVLLFCIFTVLVSCHQVCFIGSEYNPQAGVQHRWFLSHKDPCKCTAIRLGGMNMPSSSYLQRAPHYLDGLILTEDVDEIRVYFKCKKKTTTARPTTDVRPTTATRPTSDRPTCPTTASGATTVSPATAECPDPQPLGMEDGTIPNDHIEASSHCVANSYFPWQGRLNNEESLWKPSSYDENPWIEVDLTDISLVSGVITKSRVAAGYPGYVKKYKVAYKELPASDYEYVSDADGYQEFCGNTNATTPVINWFNENVMATVVRVEPTEWYDEIRLQLELLGCRSE